MLKSITRLWLLHYHAKCSVTHVCNTSLKRPRENLKENDNIQTSGVSSLIPTVTIGDDSSSRNGQWQTIWPRTRIIMVLWSGVVHNKPFKLLPLTQRHASLHQNTKCLLCREAVEVLDWPSRNFDLNLIQNVLCFIRRYSNNPNTIVCNVADFRFKVYRMWNEILLSSTIFVALVSTACPRRVHWLLRFHSSTLAEIFLH